VIVKSREPQLKGVQIARHITISLLLKRIADMFFSIIALTVLLPLILVVSVAIVIDSPGGVLFAQTRVGLNGRLFRMLKFRSMYIDADKRIGDPLLIKDAEAAGKVLKLDNDPRVTRVGKFIRTTSIDELPQLVNVLLGHMSIVGPRALIPSMLKPFPEWAKAREVVPPGITGLWQVSARDHNESLADMIEYDLEYISNWSLWQDLVIMFRTPMAVFSRKGAV